MHGGNDTSHKNYFRDSCGGINQPNYFLFIFFTGTQRYTEAISPSKLGSKKTRAKRLRGPATLFGLASINATREGEGAWRPLRWDEARRSPVPGNLGGDGTRRFASPQRFAKRSSLPQ